MADPMEIEQKNVDLMLKKSQKSTKRKRSEEIVGLIEEKGANIDKLNEEMKSLFGFFNELKKDEAFRVEDLLESGGVSLDLAIGVVIEESHLSLSRLVEDIFEKLKGKFGISLGCVKSKVILIGQRCCYGLCNVDVDVLEDDSESALWCWETRDLKLMPKSTRNLLKIRRTCRKKIHERIMALASMIDVLKKSQIHEHCPSELVKASEKLGRMLNEEDIRKLVESMTRKNNNEMADKEAKCGEKLSLKQLEKRKREAEKEKKRVARELEKEKLQREREQKQMQDEAEKEARRREKEESDKRKHLKRQQEELEKEHQRKEREKTELKMQTSLQKQASLMERFLKKAKPAPTSLGDQSLQKATSTTNGDAKMHTSVTHSMDEILSLNDQFDSENLWRCHLNSWRPLRHSKKLHWSIRQKPKKELVKELKLTTNSEISHADELKIESIGEGWVDQYIKSRVCHAETEVCPSSQKIKRHKQLLQFDKTNRPAFYGFWPKESQVVKARRPFVKDPDLDYEIDSDEEWEEEGPGENLSDCDDDETLEEGCSRGEDEEESEDGFFVPDGYLSQDEGLEVEKMDLDELAEGRNSPTTSDTPQLEDPTLPLKQQKYLFNMTDHALRRNQPLVILNLTHEKASLLLVEDLTGADKIEKMCLQALSMCAFPDCPPIEISACNDLMEENQDACSSQSNTNVLPISDSDIPQIIAVLQSNSQGISRIIDALLHKFPNTSKSQLRNKVRELADFCDNRWQVKTDVLVKFGLPTSPVRGKNRSIATFFSKRCQPPGQHFNPNETSLLSAKPGPVSQPQHCNASTEHT
ncbi:chromatin/chromatin-binding, or -regulatory protein [Lithospermum erythrorhizon]|uniref:Chromatin/chromatin-binding, or -regulatory protein n=1 Tax=Lithospermum erythrorhizon TaxID=34254 RepID=A0AAV3PCZ3_LITER